MDVEIDTAAISAEETRLQLLREREAAEAERIARDKALEEESVQLEQEIAQEIRGLNHAFTLETLVLPISIARNDRRREDQHILYT